jgi:hypothetical protein
VVNPGHARAGEYAGLMRIPDFPALPPERVSSTTFGCGEAEPPL